MPRVGGPCVRWMDVGGHATRLNSAGRSGRRVACLLLHPEPLYDELHQFTVQVHRSIPCVWIASPASSSGTLPLLPPPVS